MSGVSAAAGHIYDCLAQQFFQIMFWEPLTRCAEMKDSFPNHTGRARPFWKPVCAPCEYSSEFSETEVSRHAKERETFCKTEDLKTTCSCNV